MLACTDQVHGCNIMTAAGAGCITQCRGSHVTDLEVLGSLLPACICSTVCVERLLREDSSQVEQHRGLFKVDAALLCLLAVPEGVVPHKVHMDLPRIPADGESGFHQAQGAVVPVCE